LRVTLTPVARAELALWVEWGTPAEARRAQVILMRARAATYIEVQAETGLSLLTIVKWVHRYRAEGIEGLQDRRQRQRDVL
jgi:transposase